MLKKKGGVLLSKRIHIYSPENRQIDPLYSMTQCLTNGRPQQYKRGFGRSFRMKNMHSKYIRIQH